jgi:predicted PurR-regulated permease PerM
MNDPQVVDISARPGAADEVEERAQTLVVRVPEARTVALVALATVVVPFALYAGAAFFIPLFVSLFASYALSPIVNGMERWRVPRGIGAAITLFLVLTLAGVCLERAVSGATEVLDELPQAVQKLRYAIAAWQRDGHGPLKQVSKAAAELQMLAGATAGASAKVDSPASSAAVPATEPKALVMAGTLGMAIFVGQLVVVIFLTYFILVAGDLFRRRLIQAIGPSLTVRKKALQILREVHRVSQRYFALVLAMNVLVGICTGVGLYFLGVRHHLFWGIAMAILHTIPYLGAAAVTCAVALTAYMQFEGFVPALTAAAVPLAAAVLIGFWLQTALMGRAARMNAVVVFIALLFWGMVWGGWGLLLAIPIMASVRILFGEIERLKPLALLMGD